MKNSVSGEELFFRYSYGCAQERYLRDLISAFDFATLIRLSQGAERLSGLELRALLKRCFPTAVGNFETSRKYRGEDWEREEVAEHWHGHLGSDDLCAVRLLAVKRIENPDVFLGLDRPFKNLYGLSLKEGDRVWVHKGIITEKQE